MLPEISRRCLSCGAAVRAGSRFCQQCGKVLDAEGAPEGQGAEAARAAAPPAGEWSPPPEQAAPATNEWAPPTKEFVAFEQSTASAGAEEAPPPEPAPSEVPTATVHEVEPASSEVAAQAAESSEDSGGAAGDLRGRVARVREGTRARVGRMREEAIVVLEETPDDSGLRFVFVAAALFVISLVLLFLSTTVLR